MPPKAKAVKMTFSEFRGDAGLQSSLPSGPRQREPGEEANNNTRDQRGSGAPWKRDRYNDREQRPGDDGPRGSDESQWRRGGGDRGRGGYDRDDRGKGGDRFGGGDRFDRGGDRGDRGRGGFDRNRDGPSDRADEADNWRRAGPPRDDRPRYDDRGGKGGGFGRDRSYDGDRDRGSRGGGWGRDDGERPARSNFGTGKGWGGREGGDRWREDAPAAKKTNNRFDDLNPDGEGDAEAAEKPAEAGEAAAERSADVVERARSPDAAAAAKEEPKRWGDRDDEGEREEPAPRRNWGDRDRGEERGDRGGKGGWGADRDRGSRWGGGDRDRGDGDNRRFDDRRGGGFDRDDRRGGGFDERRGGGFDRDDRRGGGFDRDRRGGGFDDRRGGGFDRDDRRGGKGWDRDDRGKGGYGKGGGRDERPAHLRFGNRGKGGPSERSVGGGEQEFPSLAASKEKEQGNNKGQGASGAGGKADPLGGARAKNEPANLAPVRGGQLKAKPNQKEDNRSRYPAEEDAEQPEEDDQEAAKQEEDKRAAQAEREKTLSSDLKKNVVNVSEKESALERALRELGATVDGKALADGFDRLDLGKEDVRVQLVSLLTKSLTQPKPSLTLKEITTILGKSAKSAVAAELLTSVLVAVKDKKDEHFLREIVDAADNREVLAVLGQEEKSLDSALRKSGLFFLKPAPDLAGKVKADLAAGVAPAHILKEIEGKADASVSLPALIAPVAEDALSKVFVAKQPTKIDAITPYLPLLRRAAKSDLRLQCQILFATQGAWFKAGKPAVGVKELFTAYFENEVCSGEAFRVWKEDTTDKTQGKGFAIIKVNTWIEELPNDEDEGDDGEDEGEEDDYLQNPNKEYFK